MFLLVWVPKQSKVRRGTTAAGELSIALQPCFSSRRAWLCGDLVQGLPSRRWLPWNSACKHCTT